MESRWEVRRLAPSTKLALANALKKLLQKKFLDDITVKELVEECEVNRQTFYYHFQDIYDLLRWFLEHETSEALRGADCWQDALRAAFRYVQDNHLAIYHVYRSSGRDHLDCHFFSLARAITASTLAESARDLPLPERELDFLADFYILTKRFALPQVVGALLAGLLLGPAMLGVLQETTLMDQLAELGVIVLMFNAGLETDLGELKRSGKAAFVIALIGVLVPLAGGFALAAAFNRGPDAFLQNVFIGVVLTATSVSITVETLKEIGRLSTRSGSAILGAAIIDDVLGIIGLTVITSLGGGGANVWVVLGKIAAFFAVSVVVWMVMHRFVDWWFRRYSRDKRRFVVLSFAFCLLYSFFAEAVFGVADITGAYIAGLIFANTCRVAYLQDRFDTLSYALLSPIFFASIGLKVVLPEMSTTILLFAVLLVLWAVVSKVVGCGLGAKLCRYSNQDALRIGVGMISRGEVALIVANNGIAAGLMKEEFFGPVVLMVIATTILTPVLLKLVYRGKEHDYSDLQESELVNAYEDAAAFDLASQALLEDHENLKQSARKK